MTHCCSDPLLHHCSIQEKKLLKITTDSSRTLILLNFYPTLHPNIRQYIDKYLKSLMQTDQIPPSLRTLALYPNHYNLKYEEPFCKSSKELISLAPTGILLYWWLQINNHCRRRIPNRHWSISQSSPFLVLPVLTQLKWCPLYQCLLALLKSDTSNFLIFTDSETSLLKLQSVHLHSELVSHVSFQLHHLLPNADVYITFLPI